MDDLSVLPTGFTWGVATSAYQIEGAASEDGRAPSIWDTFSHTPGKTGGGDTGDVACDFYHRWAGDIGIMKDLGVDAYRFSIAWPRVIPDGYGPVNRAGLAFYDRLVDALLEAGIAPFPTLYHWDLPQALQDRGGWAARETAERFADYAALVAGALGDRVKNWVTINEPRCAAWIGNLEGRHAPGLADIDIAVPVSYHLLLGHGLGVQAVRAGAAGARVGIVNVMHTCEPATGRPEDIEATARYDGHVNRWWLDPIHGRGFPADMEKVYRVAPARPARGPGDDRRAAGLRGRELLLPHRHHRRPRWRRPLRARTAARRRSADHAALGDPGGRAGGGAGPAGRRVRGTAGVRHRERVGLGGPGDGRTAGSTTGTGSATCRSTWPRAAGPRRAGSRSPVTSPGRCWTTSNGTTATTPGSAWCTSTSPPSSGC